MSNYAPGWYPDGSGRYAQRYYDGSRWTEHVLDGSGQRAVDHVPGVTTPTATGGSPRPAAVGTSEPYRAPARTSWAQPGAAAVSATPTATGYQPSLGTSASSFQFGEAPTHERAYAGAGSTTADAPAAGAPGFRLTVGALAAVVGLVLVALAVLVLAYWSGGGITVSLGDISGANAGLNGLATAYANVGRWVGLAAVAGVVAVAVLDGLGNRAVVERRRPLAVAAAVAGAVFALWHLAGLFLTPDVATVDVGPAPAGFVGVLGYLAAGGWGFLRQRVGGRR